MKRRALKFWGIILSIVYIVASLLIFTVHAADSANNMTEIASISVVDEEYHANASLSSFDVDANGTCAILFRINGEHWYINLYDCDGIFLHALKIELLISDTNGGRRFSFSPDGLLQLDLKWYDKLLIIDPLGKLIYYGAYPTDYVPPPDYVPGESGDLELSGEMETHTQEAVWNGRRYVATNPSLQERIHHDARQTLICTHPDGTVQTIYRDAESSAKQSRRTMNMINYWFPLFFLTLMLLGVYQISRKRNEAAGILKPRLKRWKRGAVFYKLKPFVCAAFFVAVAAGVCLLLVGVKNIFSAIFLVIFCALLLLILVDILSTAYRYVYAEHAIQLFYGPLVYKKLNYDCLDGIIIANAASNNKIRRNQPYTPEDDHILSYKCKSSTGTTEVIYPYIVLYKTEGRRATLALLKAGMSSRAVAYDAGKGCVCLGICWFDSFAELLQHTTIPAYLLEDVYLRFRGMFDAILAKHGHECDRFYIVTNRAIPYQTYLNQHSGTP